MFEVGFGGALAPRCDGVSRRHALRVGALGGLGLAHALRIEAQAGTASNPRAKAAILVYLGGGLSHHDSFDLKPEAPDEIRGKYKGIATDLPGLSIGELLPRVATMMGKVALIRSAAHSNDHHETATNWVLSGRFGSPFGDYPSIGSVVCHELGFKSALPPYVAIPRNPSFTWELGKSAFLGGRFESFKTGDPNDSGFRAPDVLPGFGAARTDRRADLLSAVDTLAARVESDDQLATYDEFGRRAADMVLSPQARRAFAIGEEDPKLRDRYGRTTFGQSCLLARRLIERGTRFATINYGGWDHHAKIFENLDKKLPEFDRGYSALIEDLAARGLLESTLVLAMGEFGRTPKLNKDKGRDHWGPAGSLLFAGAGVRGGLVLGKTDRIGGQVTQRPVSPADVACTVYEALGVDPRATLLTPEGRPVEALDRGEAVRELWA